jgi:ribosomal protein S18 acetylase RimI-like enzyme
MQYKNFNLKVITQDFDKEYKLLQNKLRANNIARVGKDIKRKPLMLLYYDKKNNLIAGLYGYQSWGMFYIDLLWVNEDFRLQKLGTKLLKTAEEYAVKNKALYVRVNTASFQAPEFYLKNGYEIFGKLPMLVDAKEQHYDYYLVKYLT